MQRRSSPQDISWFLDARSNNQLNLDPSYQRRSVWNARDRRFFLDTVFRGYPCPPIFLHKTLGEDQRTIYAVVDGKQRLQTLFLFVDGQISLSDDFDDDRFNGMTWSQLGQDERKAFWDYVIPVEFLTFDIQDTRVVSQAFDRLNRNMRKLEAQELRHARWDGWFIQRVESECDSPAWKELGVVTDARSKRMKDAQFVSELLLVLIEGRQLGFDQDMLDDAYARYDDVEEATDTFSPDDVVAQLESTKNYLLEMERVQNCVRPAARSLAHFYTLWTLAALHRTEFPAPQCAAAYKTFTDAFNALRTADDPTRLVTDDPPGYRDAYEYLQGYGGASTDITPRTKRLDSLLAYLRRAVQ